MWHRVLPLSITYCYVVKFYLIIALFLVPSHLTLADVNFTVVRPPGLGKEGPTSEEIKENIGGQTVPGMSPGKGTQRGDVAQFMLKALTCGAYDRKMVAITT